MIWIIAFSACSALLKPRNIRQLWHRCCNGSYVVFTSPSAALSSRCSGGSASRSGGGNGDAYTFACNYSSL